MIFFPDGYVKQMQLSVKCGNQKLTSNAVCALPSPTLIKREGRGGEKKSVGEMFTEWMFAWRTLLGSSLCSGLMMNSL